MTERFQPGMVFSERVEISAALVESFAALSGDWNPVHLNSEAAQEYGYARPFAHGAILSAVVSKIIGMKVPGPGAVWMNQSMEWLRPVFVGETVTVETRIDQASPGANVLVLKLGARNESDQEVMKGSATVKIAEKIAAEDTAPTETRVALVTGGSRGIGAAIARALGQAGYEIAVAYRSQKAEAERLVGELATAGCRAQSFACDLAVEGSGGALIAEVTRDLGRVDTVVHAATQPLISRAVGELETTDFRDYWRVHVEAAQEMVNAALPQMIERRFGRLIFIGTSALLGAPPPRMAAYVTAKQALWGLVRCLSLELGPQQITANMISPGMTITDLGADIPQRVKEMEARRVPLRRLATPSDIGGLAAFLAGGGGSYINGQNLPVTGGPM